MLESHPQNNPVRDSLGEEFTGQVLLEYLNPRSPSTHKHHSAFWCSFLHVNLSLLLKEKKTKQDSMSSKAPFNSTLVITTSDASSLTLDLGQIILQ